MRSMSTATLALSLCSVAALRADSPPNLTVLLSVGGNISPVALSELRNELNDIMIETGRKLDVRLRNQAAPSETFEDVVMV